MVKNPSANAGDAGDTDSIPESEDPLEEEMATHSNILSWKSLWTEETGGLQSMGLKRVKYDLTSEHTCTLDIISKWHLSFLKFKYVWHLYFMVYLCKSIFPDENEGKKIIQIKAEKHSTKYLSSIDQNCKGHQKQRIFEKTLDMQELPET